jgi:Spy/CpxP family protein refolding chaperone
MTKLIVILGFALSFAAGMVIGSKSRGLINPVAPTSAGEPRPTTRPERRGWLTQELGLSPEQRAKLDGIWSAVASRGRDEQEDRRRDYRRERDAAIADLVPPARLGEYDQIINTYTDRVAALEQESREAYHDAVERTKAILTPEQRVKYEELLKRHRWGPGPSRDRHTSRRAETQQATASQPAADPSDPQSPPTDSPKGAQ